MLTEKFIALNAYIMTEEKLKVNHVSIHFVRLINEEAITLSWF